MTKQRVNVGASTALKIGLAATGSLAMTWAAPNPAAAQPVSPVGSAPAYDPFNSFSVGIGGGWDWFRAPASISSEDYLVQQDAFSPVVAGNGGFGTLEIGKDFRFGQAVLGVYGDYAFGHKDGSASHSVGGGLVGSNGLDGPVGAPPLGLELTTSAYLRLDTSHAVVGRLGFLYAPQTLVYGLVGYMWQDYEARLSVTSTIDCCTAIATRSGQTGGMVFGVGAETMIYPDWSLKAEYRFARLGGIPSFGATNDDLSVSGSFDHIDDHIVRFVASYKIH